MNRCEFIGQAQNGNQVSAEDVLNFFDHAMAVYDIVKDIKDAHIHSIQDIVHSSLRIQVESSNIPELEGVVNYVNNEIHNRTKMYDRSFRLDAEINGNTANLFIREDF